jgi:regulator of sirC expression with transglutaminase-like and TPR domain
MKAEASARASVASVTWLDRFAEVVNRPSVPLDEAAFLLASPAHPTLDVDEQCRRLDQLASEVSVPTIDGVRKLLFASGRFVGNTANYYDIENSYLNMVLDSGLGIPISLSVLAIEVGRRVGAPVHGVGMPGHFLLRDKVDPSVFIDPFHGGRELTVVDCQARFRRDAPPGAVWTDDYLAPVGHLAIIYRMLGNMLAITRQSRDIALLVQLLRMRSSMPIATETDQTELERVSARLN